MTFKRAERAAEVRGMELSQKRWLNNMVGYGYAVTMRGEYFPTFYTDTLKGAYDFIMRYPKEH